MQVDTALNQEIALVSDLSSDIFLCYMEKGRCVSSIWMRFKLEPSNSKESCKKYLYFVIFKVFTEILGHKDMIY